MTDKTNSIDFSTSTPTASSESFVVAKSRAASTSLALDQVELRLDLQELPAGPVDIVLHTTAGDAAGLGLAVAVNGHETDHCAVHSEHRLSIPTQHLAVGENIIRLAKVPLFVTRISAVVSGTSRPNQSTDSKEPLSFGLGVDGSTN